MTLPAALVAALERQSGAVRIADLQAASGTITGQYRSGQSSSLAVTSVEAALAYALVRMPATYAAISDVLARVAGTFPAFSPSTLTDVGSGPGTASFAAVERWPQLTSISMLEPHPALAGLARQLAAEMPHPAFATIRQDARRAEAAQLPEADLVVAAYVAVEMPETALAALTSRLVAATGAILVLVEPGTPEGYRRLMLMRSQAIAAGMHVVAPCPHDGPCPLESGDWCHFSVRVQRSRLHRQIKQVELGHEDEKFAYVVLSHAVPPSRPVRILAPPLVTKIGTNLKLCTENGIETRHVAARDKAASRAIRRLGWGDALAD